MALWLTAASSQNLTKTTPVTAVPFSLGIWVYPINTTSQEIVTINESAGDNQFALEFYKDTAFNILAGAGSPTATATAGTVTTGAWHFCLVRCIANTNRRLSVLNVSGSVSHAQTTTNRSPSGQDRIRIGEWGGSSGGANYDGGLAEFWLTNVDVFPGGGAATDDFVRQLAYRGPFSIPRVANNLIEYLSFRTLPGRGNGYDWYAKNRAQASWTYSGTPVNSPHPPLPYYYIRPGQRQSLTVLV